MLAEANADVARLYGPWAWLARDELSAAVAGWAAPWWVCGPDALAALAGPGPRSDRPRIGFFERDLPSLRRHLAGSYDLWGYGAGTLRPVTDRYPQLHDQADRIWLRRDGASPWQAELLVSPGDPGQYRVRFFGAFHTPLERATWVNGDGTRYLNPEIVLAFRAADGDDLGDPTSREIVAALTPEATVRLRLMVRAVDPAHPWLTHP